MKIFQNYNVQNISGLKHKPSFMQNNIANDANNNTEIPQVTADYDVKKPISYKKIEDINLGNNLTARYYKLGNGQRVIIVPKKGPTVVKTYVNTGSLNEPDELRGISHYIEHNLFNGSEALGDKNIFDEVNKLGGYANASTSFSITDYIIESNLLEEGDLESKIQLQAGMLQTPKFLNDKLEKEKKIVDSEINMYLSDDTTRAETITLKNLFNIKSKAPDLIAGSTDNIDALTREDVVNYFNNNYNNSNMVTVITGDVDEDETIKLVSKYFNNPAKAVPPQYNEPMTVTDKPVRQDIISSKKTGATEIFLGFAGPQNSNYIDSIYLRAVNHLLFGLSYSRMKNIEQKYSSEILLQNERLGTRKDDYGAMILQTFVPEEYAESFIKDIYNVIDNLANNPPSEKEFKAIKTQIKKINSIAMQSSESLNYCVGSDFLNSTPYKTAEYNSIIDNMTVDDFVNTVKKYYNLNQCALTVVHPKYSTEKSIEDNYNKSKNLSFTGSNHQLPLDIETVKEYKMPNNFSIVLQDENTDVANISLKIFTKDLSPKKAAIGDVLYDMLQYCGTKNHKWQELADMSDSNAISSDISGGICSLSITGDAPVENFSKIMELFSENIKNPDLSQELFENALQHCKDKYQTAEPSAYQPFKKAMHEGTHSAYTTEDKLKSLDNITLQDVLQLYNEIMTKGQGQVVVTAPFTQKPQLKQAVFDSVAKFNAVQPKNTDLTECYKPIDHTQVYTTETNKNQSEIIQGYKFKQSGNIKDNMCLDLFNYIFGGSQSSRLFSDLREQRHLAYFVNSGYKLQGDSGIEYLKIKTTTNNTETGEKTLDNIKKSIDGFNENIKKITTEKISDEELATAKRAIKSEILSSIEMNSSKHSLITAYSNSPYGVNYLNEQLRVLDNITPEDILNTARNIFSGKPVYSVSGSKEALDYNKEYFESLKNA